MSGSSVAQGIELHAAAMEKTRKTGTRSSNRVAALYALYASLTAQHPGVLVTPGSRLFASMKAFMKYREGCIVRSNARSLIEASRVHPDRERQQRIRNPSRLPVRTDMMLHPKRSLQRALSSCNRSIA